MVVSPACMMPTRPPSLTPAPAGRARRQRTGAKIQCSSCYTAYHPLCARIAGLHMEILDGTEESPDAPVRGWHQVVFMHACMRAPTGRARAVPPSPYYRLRCCTDPAQLEEAQPATLACCTSVQALVSAVGHTCARGWSHPVAV